MARAQLGVAPAQPTDEVTLSWVRAEYPSYSVSVSADADYSVVLPEATGPQMELYEVYNAADVPIVVLAPEDAELTVGVSRGTILDVGRTGFLGFRYSPQAGKWFLLSVTVQQIA